MNRLVAAYPLVLVVCGAALIVAAAVLAAGLVGALFAAGALFIGAGVASTE